MISLLVKFLDTICKKYYISACCGETNQFKDDNNQLHQHHFSIIVICFTKTKKEM